MMRAIEVLHLVRRRMVHIKLLTPTIWGYDHVGHHRPDPINAYVADLKFEQVYKDIVIYSCQISVRLLHSINMTLIFWESINMTLELDLLVLVRHGIINYDKLNNSKTWFRYIFFFKFLMLVSSDQVKMRVICPLLKQLYIYIIYIGILKN